MNMLMHGVDYQNFDLYKGDTLTNDLYGDELVQPIENFKPIYRRAKSEGLRLKAHVGEWGTADDVLIFDSDVSKEYLRLYQSGCLDAEELDDIRKNGLKAV